MHLHNNQFLFGITPIILFQIDESMTIQKVNFLIISWCKHYSKLLSMRVYVTVVTRNNINIRRKYNKKKNGQVLVLLGAGWSRLIAASLRKELRKFYVFLVHLLRASGPLPLPRLIKSVNPIPRPTDPSNNNTAARGKYTRIVHSLFIIIRYWYKTEKKHIYTIQRHTGF